MIILKRIQWVNTDWYWETPQYIWRMVYLLFVWETSRSIRTGDTRKYSCGSSPLCSLKELTANAVNPKPSYYLACFRHRVKDVWFSKAEKSTSLGTKWCRLQSDLSLDLLVMCANVFEKCITIPRPRALIWASLSPCSDLCVVAPVLKLCSLYLELSRLQKGFRVWWSKWSKECLDIGCPDTEQNNDPGCYPQNWRKSVRESTDETLVSPGPKVVGHAASVVFIFPKCYWHHIALWWV